MMNNSGTILEGLDDSQKEAVECPDGPVLIVAGAGAGKTRVLTSRVAYIIGAGCPPDRILALTFTKKAASEMKKRIAEMVGTRNARRIWMGTFHSVFIRFLRSHSAELGYPGDFTIYDAAESQNVVKGIIRDMRLDDKSYKPRDVMSRISMAKNNLVTPEGYRKNSAAIMDDTRARKPRICDIYFKYQEILKQSGVMDFDDILVNMFSLLRYNEPVLEEISSLLEHIFVDEYQDTNFVQYQILRLLSLKTAELRIAAARRNGQPTDGIRPNICVVGDDSQSIYAFRGAKIQNILNFKEDYPGCRVFRLERNYRSTKNIVNAANSVIARNEGRIPKACFSDGETGERISLIKAYTETEEATLLASSIISTMQKDHCTYQDFAILYRTNAQSRAIEESLRKRNLPYVIYSGHSFYEREEVKDMMAYLKLIVNPADDGSFRRIVNKPARGVGNTSLFGLITAAGAEGKSLMEAAYSGNLTMFGLKHAAIQKIRAFVQMIEKAHEMLVSSDAYTIAAYIASESGLYRFYKEDNSVEGQTKAANIEEVMNSAKVFIEEKLDDFIEDKLAEGLTEEEIETLEKPLIGLGDYLENVSLLSAVDVEATGEDTRNKIALMTVHAAKGLEFRHVYVTGMEENLFPSGGFLATQSEIEEERRLFYVAMTRAQVSLHISYASSRMRNGRHEANPVSRFVREIDRTCLANPLRAEPDGAEYGAGHGSRSGGLPGSPGYKGSASGAYKWGHPASGLGYSASGFGRTSISGLSSSGSSNSTGFFRSSNSAPGYVPDPDFQPVPVLEFKVGQRIEHNRFGFGIIREISGDRGDLRAVIDFEGCGRKVLMLKYAKMRFPKS